MAVKGKKENIDTFINMMEQKGSVWMGRGAEVFEKKHEDFDNMCRYILKGCLKWSVYSSLVHAAKDMRENPSDWYFGDKPPKKIVSIYEACKQLGLDMECYSEETNGCFFEEHYLFQNGELVESEKLEIIEDYNEEEGVYSLKGGYKNREFVV